MNVTPGTGSAWYPLPRGWRQFAAETPGAVLLETAGGNAGEHVSLLFAQPRRILRAESPGEVDALLTEVDRALGGGEFAAGYLTYEAGAALLGISARPDADRPLALVGIFGEPQRFDHATGSASGPSFSAKQAEAGVFAGALLGELRAELSAEEYGPLFAEVQRHIAAGDTYQVNLTTALRAELRGRAADLYEALIAEQPVDYAAIVNLGDEVVLSFSPELFFRVDAPEGGAPRRIRTRPMKGTAARGGDAAEDARQREFLARDEKNRAEHVMIVDLLRNDLGRICRTGSIAVDRLFAVETYPTVFQMTSEISGELREEAGLRAVWRALLPSGSVTGAPKMSTMGIIRKLEPAARGVYTGAVFHASPGGEACASVAIRTLELRSATVRMGIGGGVVADSTASDEYAECLLKASFLQPAARGVELIETLLWDGGAFPLIERHLGRLKRSAAELGFPCDASAVREALALAAASLSDGARRRFRVLLGADGPLRVEHAEFGGQEGSLRVRLAKRRVDSADPWLQHKTTRRALYEREYRRALADGFAEAVFLNERGELTEGCISNLFVELEGRLWTPPLACGVLPGVLREHILATNARAGERVLRLEDLRLAENAYVGNALRGLRSLAYIDAE